MVHHIVVLWMHFVQQALATLWRTLSTLGSSLTLIERVRCRSLLILARRVHLVVCLMIQLVLPFLFSKLVFLHGKVPILPQSRYLRTLGHTIVQG